MLTEDLKKYRIILASRSPRRNQLLNELGITFDVVIKDYEESLPENLNGEEAAIYLSRHKAACFSDVISDNVIIITADTIVWCNGKILGKPVNADDARMMIRELSGNTHEVITAVTLKSSSKETTFADITRVTFDPLSEEEISYYIETFSPYDKAGAYGIQEWIGIAACSRIEGSYFNVMGLPVQRLYRELKEFIR